MTYTTPRPGHLQVRPVDGKSLRPLFARRLDQCVLDFGVTA